MDSLGTRKSYLGFCSERSPLSAKILDESFEKTTSLKEIGVLKINF